MKRSYRIVAVAACAVTTAMVSAQQNFNIGGSIGLYMPTNAGVRAALGNSSPRLGFGPVDTDQRQNGLRPSFGVINVAKNGNRLLAIPITYGYERKFGSGVVAPYGRVFGGLSYLDYRLNINGANFAGRKFVPVFGGVLGVTLSSYARVFARYTVMSSTSGVNFSGLELVASFSLFKL